MNNPAATEWLLRPGGLAEQMARFRGRRGYSGRRLASALGWSDSKISRLESGKQVPTEVDLRKWADALLLDADTFAKMEDLLAEFRAAKARHGYNQQSWLYEIDMRASEVSFRVGDPFDAEIVRVIKGKPDVLLGVMRNPATAAKIVDLLNRDLHQQTWGS